MVSLSAADAKTGRPAGVDDNDHDDTASRRDQLPGRTGREIKRVNEAARYANGIFILIRATSVSCTTADFAMWRFNFPLFDESK